MIVYHGSIKKFDRFDKKTVVQNLNYGIDTIGIWFTSDFNSAKSFAYGTELVIEKSKTEFWDDGLPKVVQFDRPVSGYIYKVYIGDPNLKEYHSDSQDSFELFMRERDNYCDYLGSKKRNPIWNKDQAILLNKEEANAEFCKHLINQGYEGILIKKTMLDSGTTDLYCLFSEDTLYITDVSPADKELEELM